MLNDYMAIPLIRSNAEIGLWLEWKMGQSRVQDLVFLFTIGTARSRTRIHAQER